MIIQMIEKRKEETMADLKTIDTAIKTYVKLIDNPLAVKMIPKGDKISSNAKKPLEDFGTPMALCQAFALSRKEGLTILLDKDSQSCPIALAGLGFVKPDVFLTGEHVLAPVNQSVEARKKRAKQTPRFEYANYDGILIGPLASADFEPDVILMYGSAAQVMRMIQAAVFSDGISLTSASSGSGGCMLPVAGTMLADECKYSLPGNGERRLGLVADHEMAFGMPSSCFDTVVEGLKLSHDGKQNFPISPGYLKSEYKLPPTYNALREALLATSGSA
jgi:uncharacterized protein (DUF169 family)